MLVIASERSPLPPYDQRPQVTNPEAAYDLVRPHLAPLDREACILVALDVKHRLIVTQLLSLGTVDHTFMAPRDILRACLLHDASAFFLAHNHPSGDPTPSADDRRVTRRIATAASTVGVDFLDHLVVGDTFSSLARLGAI